MVIGIDFDGTCVTHEYPEIGESIGAEKVLRDLVKNGHQLVLCTMRGHKAYEGRDLLQEAVDWFEKNGIKLSGVNRMPLQDTWTDSPKPYAQMYSDDAALECPIIESDISGYPYVNWEKVDRIFRSTGIIST